MTLDSIGEASLLAPGSEGNLLLWNIILQQLREAKWLLVDSLISI
jgi:hypothetical protein